MIVLLKKGYKKLPSYFSRIGIKSSAETLKEKKELAEEKARKESISNLNNQETKSINLLLQCLREVAPGFAGVFYSLEDADNISVESFKSEEEAIEIANDTDVSFQASIFSNNIDETMSFYKKINASAVFHNDHTAFRVDWMPFAGLKHSGHGVGGIKYTMHEMQIEKMMVLRN